MGKKTDATAKKAEGGKTLTRREFFKKGAVAGVGATILAGLGTTGAQRATDTGIEWDFEADVVVIGAGAAGLPAAIRARDLGASVLVVDQNFEPGGRALHSGGWVSLGGGDPIQKRDLAGTDPDGFGLTEPLVPPEALDEDPDFLFKDVTDWSVVGGDAVARFRYNDPNQHRGWADACPASRQFLMDNYVRFSRINGTHNGGGLLRARSPYTMLREGDVTDIRAGTVSSEDAGEVGVRSSTFAPSAMPDAEGVGAPGWRRNGAALMRPLEFSAKEKGVQFLFNRHMDEIIREQPFSGRVIGIKASYSPRLNPETGERLVSYAEQVGGEWARGVIDDRRETVHIRARKAVIVATAGYQHNPHFRSMFYPAMGDPAIVGYDWGFIGPKGMDASGIIAGTRVGANLSGVTHAYQFNTGFRLRPGNALGSRDPRPKEPGHPAFVFQGGIGLNIGAAGWEHVILVNQVGKRFYNERDVAQASSSELSNLRWGGNTPLRNGWEDHVHGDWRNCSVDWIKEIYAKPSPLEAAVRPNEGSQPPNYFPGPVWAIFDAASVERGGWNVDPPYTANDGYFHKADTLMELAVKVMGHPHQHMPLRNLEETVARYNEFADTGADEDFERDGPMHPIATPPFYAAAATIGIHDSNGGLQTNGKMQVLDSEGNPIPGLYTGGEASGGGFQHGLGRAIPHGYIAGGNAAQELADAPTPTARQHA